MRTFPPCWRGKPLSTPSPSTRISKSWAGILPIGKSAPRLPLRLLVPSAQALPKTKKEPERLVSLPPSFREPVCRDRGSIW